MESISCLRKHTVEKKHARSTLAWGSREGKLFFYPARKGKPCHCGDGGMGGEGGRGNAEIAKESATITDYLEKLCRTEYN
jgi:hypothetical protein